MIRQMQAGPDLDQLGGNRLDPWCQHTPTRPAFGFAKGTGIGGRGWHAYPSRISVPSKPVPKAGSNSLLAACALDAGLIVVLYIASPACMHNL